MLIVIILCAVLARNLNGNETLAQYAEKHPDNAYGTSIESSSSESSGIEH